MDSSGGSLTKLGVGMLTLTNSNTYSGTTTVNAGTLQLGNGMPGFDGSIAGNIVDNGALVYNLNGGQTYGGIIAGSGSVTKIGSNTLTLEGNNSYSGPTVINGGTLKLAANRSGNASFYTNLQVYYPFEGNGADASGNGRNLVLYGGAGFGPGLFGQGLALQGNPNQYAQRPTSDSALDFGSNSFTIQLWVDFNTTDEQTLLEKFSGSTGPGWSITAFRQDTVTATMEFYGDGVGSLDTPSLPITMGTWHQVVVRREGSSFDLFIDDTLDATMTSSGTVTASPNPLLIGKRNPQDGRNFPLHGTLDEIAIWNRPLTDSQIAALYNNGLGSTGSILSAASPIVVASGSTLDLNAVGNVVVASLSDYSPGNGGSIINSSTANSSVLTVSPAGGSTTFSGMIQGGGTLGTISLVLSGSGTQVVSGSNTYSGSTTINAGVLQATDAVGLPSNSNLMFSGNLAQNGNGAVFQSSGTFSRSLGTGAGQVQWTGDGGFAANGGKLTVKLVPAFDISGNALSASSPLVWGNNSGTSSVIATLGFVPDGNALTFGSPTANSQVEFQNSIDLNGETHQIDVAAGAGGDRALLSGSLINSQSNGMGGLLKTGLGTLVLSGTNSYDGGTEVAAGTLEITTTAALPSGTSLTVGDGGTFIFDPSAADTPLVGSAASGVTTVPEPGTLALAIAGAAMSAAYRWRRGCSNRDRRGFGCQSSRKVVAFPTLRIKPPISRSDGSPLPCGGHPHCAKQSLGETDYEQSSGGVN